VKLQAAVLPEPATAKPNGNRAVALADGDTVTGPVAIAVVRRC